MSARALSYPAIFGVGVTGIALYSCMDAVVKGLTLAIGVYNAMLWRFAVIVAIAGAVNLARGLRRPSRAAMRLHLMRGAVSTVMALLFFWGLARVPMAQAISLTYIAPLIALFLAAALLGERIGRAVIAGSIVASGGIGFILLGQATSGGGDEGLWGTIAILGSAVCYSWNLILLRQQSQVSEPIETALWQSLVVGALLLLGAPWFAALPPPGRVAPILLGGALATASMAILSWAYARAEASYLAPTEYTSFVWAALLGWLVFGEHVSLYTVAGAALIVGGCAIAARRKPEALAHEAEAALP